MFKRFFDHLFFFSYAKQHGFPHLVHTTLPRMGAVQAILKEVGPRLESDGSENTLTKSRSSSTSRLKLLKDTVDALREKKYVKGEKIHSLL